MTTAYDSLDVQQIADDAWVWVWTSPGGACHQGPKQYKRRASAERAGQQWLDRERR